LTAIYSYLQTCSFCLNELDIGIFVTCWSASRGSVWLS